MGRPENLTQVFDETGKIYIPISIRKKIAEKIFRIVVKNGLIVLIPLSNWIKSKKKTILITGEEKIEKT